MRFPGKTVLSIVVGDCFDLPMYIYTVYSAKISFSSLNYSILNLCATFRFCFFKYIQYVGYAIHLLRINNRPSDMQNFFTQKIITYLIRVCKLC